MSYFTSPQIKLLLEMDVDLSQAERLARTGDLEALARYMMMQKRLRTSEFDGDPVKGKTEKLKGSGWKHRQPDLVPVLVTITYDPICDDPEHIANPELCGEGYTSEQAVEGAQNLLRHRGFEVGNFESEEATVRVHYGDPDFDDDDGYIIGLLEVDNGLADRLIEDGYFEANLGDNSIHVFAEMP